MTRLEPPLANLDYPVQKPQGIVIDFDGVISQNAMLVAIDFVHSFVNRSTPFSREHLLDYCRVLNCLPFQKAVPILLESLGMLDRIYELHVELSRLIEHGGQRITTEPAFVELASWCAEQGVALRVFSLSNPKRLLMLAPMLDPGSVLPLDNQSKANVGCYRSIAGRLGADAGRWLCIDDDPFALRSASLAGFRTAQVDNPLLPMADYADYARFVDRRFRSLADLLKALRAGAGEGGHEHAR